MKKGNKLYEGKAKKIFETDQEGLVIVEYKDDATAFDGQKKGQIQEKGSINAEISAIFFQLLEEAGIPTHFVKKLTSTELLVRDLDIIMVEVVMRNLVAGGLSSRLGLEEGTRLPEPVLEFSYKSDELGDPLINEYHIKVLELATESQLSEMSRQAFKINRLLKEFLQEKGIDLVDFKLEFGIDHEGQLLLGDEISPDTCRFWDSQTGEKLDKDRFRRDLGNVEGAYKEILSRLESN
ncbi:MAG: phosphoribosylaminoimidazolesuccinocarboxamide synthase [Bacillota bacterium]